MMLVTLSGITILVSELQLAKALSPILVTPSGISYQYAFPAGQIINSFLSLLNTTPSIELYIALFSETLIEHYSPKH